MNAASFRANIQETIELEEKAEGGATSRNVACSPEKPLRRVKQAPQPVPCWAVTSVAPDVYQIGPWFVDVRHGVQGTECLSLTSIQLDIFAEFGFYEDFIQLT